VYRRTQQGLNFEPALWVSNQRRAAQDDEAGGRSSALSEMFIRNHYRAWLEYICNEER